MISVDVVDSSCAPRGTGAWRALEPLAVPLRDAVGCVLADDVKAQYPVPAFRTATSGGVALFAQSTVSASPGRPVAVQILDALRPGFQCETDVIAGEGVYVEVGAMLPPTCDAVFKVDGAPSWSSQVEITQPVRVGEGVAEVGSAIPMGRVVLVRGSQLDARAVGVAAAVGCDRVLVHPAPRVVVVTLGDELVPLGRTVATGLVPDATTAMLLAAVRQAGGIAIRGGPIPDSARALERAIADHIASADLVVVAANRRALPIELIGPKQTPLISIPATIQAAWHSFERVVRPAITRLAGREPESRAVPSESGRLDSCGSPTPGWRGIPAEWMYRADPIMVTSSNVSVTIGGDTASVSPAATR